MGLIGPWLGATRWSPDRAAQAAAQSRARGRLPRLVAGRLWAARSLANPVFLPKQETGGLWFQVAWSSRGASGSSCSWPSGIFCHPAETGGARTHQAGTRRSPTLQVVPALSLRPAFPRTPRGTLLPKPNAPSWHVPLFIFLIAVCKQRHSSPPARGERQSSFLSASPVPRRASGNSSICFSQIFMQHLLRPDTVFHPSVRAQCLSFTSSC